MTFEKGKPDFLSNHEEKLQVVILHKPEEKFRVNQIQKVLMEASRVANVKIEITRSSDFVKYSGFNFNPTQTPIVFINNQLEFVKAIPHMQLLKKKLQEIKNRGSMLL